MLSTDKGYIELTQSIARAGDLVSIILGCNCPMILRPIPNQQDHYHVIGPCSIEGLMMGEGLLGPHPPAEQPELKMLCTFLCIQISLQSGLIQNDALLS